MKTDDFLINLAVDAANSISTGAGQTLRDRLFDVGRGLRAAQHRYIDDRDFEAWLLKTPLSCFTAEDQTALMLLAEYEEELRPLVAETTLTSAVAIWSRYGAAATALRQTPPTEDSPDIEAAGPNGTDHTFKSRVDVMEQLHAGEVPASWQPPTTRPGNTTALMKALGDDATHLYGWFGKSTIRKVLSPLRNEQRGVPMLKSVIETVRNGSCRHAKVAASRRFDVRMAFPHLPNKFAKSFHKKRPQTIYKSWSRLAELNQVCEDRSTYILEVEAPNGRYHLRDEAHEHEIDRLAHQWWQGDRSPILENPSVDDSVVFEQPIETPNSRCVPGFHSDEFVFYGTRVWSGPEDSISFDDASNAYRLVLELHGMLKAVSPDDPTGRAMKIRHYAKWLRPLSDPGADMMFRMASAISQSPDQELEIKAPPPQNT